MIKNIIQLFVVLLFTTSGVMAQSVVIADVTQPPGEIEVQVDMLTFTDDVAAITLTIEYDSDLMDFVGINDTQLTGSWLANYNSGSDELVITYIASPTGTGYPISGKLLDMVFDYHGGFGTAITFDQAGCEIADADLGILTASYVDGSVTQSAAVGTVSMTGLTEPIGNTVDMPVTIVGTGFGAVDAITLQIGFDVNQLAFTGLDASILTGVTASATSGVLTINWTGTAQDFTTLATLFNAQFIYYGGNADVEFIPGCEISTLLTPLAVSYVDGTVVPDATVDGTFTIGSVGATSDSANVSVPITASGFGASNFGAITLQVAYHDSLIYTSYTNGALTGWILTGNSNNVLSFAWTKVAGQTPVDGDIITLNFRFDYDGGGVASIGFDPGCEVKSVNLVNIPVAYVDGSVASLGVSGILKYANTTGGVRPLASSTVYLKSGTTTVATTTTDINGNYAFSGVGVGTYTITGSTAIAWGGVNIGDAIIIKNTAGSFVPGTMLFLAADVNQSNTVNIGDAIIVKTRISLPFTKPGAWTATDWIFETISCPVIDSSVTGKTVLGICSGDANASYTF